MPPNTFLRLSAALTGEPVLDARLAGELEQRLRDYYADDLTDLLAAFEAPDLPKDPEQAALVALGTEPKRHRVAREILRIWYTGQFQTPYEGVDPPRTPEQWEQGLLWRVIKSHAPAFSKDAYGIWAKEPA